MNEQLINALGAIDVSTLGYQDWINVGFALKAEGLPCSVWDEWSQRDRRYHSGECQRKWETFNGSDTPVTAATIFQMAKERGWTYSATSAPLDWNATIGDDEGYVSRSSVSDFRRALEVLFKGDEYVGYTVTSFQDTDGKWKPYGGVYSRTCAELLATLDKYPEDLGAAIGDWKEEGGAWLRINPLDGSGLGNANVASFRYALVESDSVSLDEQKRILIETQLPIATMASSGGKSIHAIVRVDAETREEYKERTVFLYSYLKSKGLDVDEANKNPSRLTRLPGATRNGIVQKLLCTNIGAKTWNEWKKVLEENADDLPSPISLALYDNAYPTLNEELVKGVLRCGHKMIISGPSKAGKSFLLMELCIAVAEGIQWLGFDVKKGRVLYVNLEIDKSSCIQRFLKIYDAMKLQSTHRGNITVWNLRGYATPLDKLVPKLLKTMRGQSYDAVVLDPIYKLSMGGDENSASDMGAFCNQFDRICTETGAAVIYCHHHAKGMQGGKKALDRSSGSGVFARDPDAVLDITELEMPAGAEEYLGHNHGTPFRVEGALREFPPFKFRNIWFEFPLHRVDYGLLDGATIEGSRESNLNKSSRKSSTTISRKEFNTAFNISSNNGTTTLEDLAEYFGVSERTVRRYIKDYDDEFSLKLRVVSRINKEAEK